MRTKQCPICREEIAIFSDNEPGDEIYCDGCGRELTILSLSPILLEPLESYDDDYYFDEDDF